MSLPDRAEREAQALRVLREVVESSRRHYRQAERRAGMAAAPLRALAEIVRLPGITSAQLAQALGVRPATASNLLKLLEARTLVARAREARDQRVVRLHATGKGARLADSTGAGGELSVALAALDARELEALGAGLAALARQLPPTGGAPSLAFRTSARRRRA
jgi:DNA-binding MarR family transcriptional regulator